MEQFIGGYQASIKGSKMEIKINVFESVGRKGVTLFYSFVNFRFDSSDYKLKWDATRVYTPRGSQTDENGFKYFDIPADEILISRDLVDLDIVVYFFDNPVGDNVEVYITSPEDEEIQEITYPDVSDGSGSYFDITVPSNPAMPVNVNITEVTDGENK